MDELSLLRESLAALDDVFLVVVVGEFNSGKSTVINALLGERFLADGILPTTNEISVLKYAGSDGPQQPGLVQQADGLFVRYLPAELLKEMNIVDTPGKQDLGGKTCKLSPVLCCLRLFLGTHVCILPINMLIRS